MPRERVSRHVSFWRYDAGIRFVLAVCLLAFAPFLWQGWRDVRAFFFYEEAQCTVLARGFYESLGSASRHRSPDPASRRRRPELHYRVDAAGKQYLAYGFDNMNGRMSTLSDADEFETGRAYRCWYDPWNPERAILRRELRTMFYAGAAIPGVMALATWSVLASKRKRKKVEAPATTKGEYLAVRLTPDFTANSRIWIGALIVLGYGAIATACAYFIISNDKGWFFLVFLVAGLIGLVKRLVSFIRARGAGDPIVELEREPVARGEKVKIFIRHPPAPLDKLRVVVRCETLENRKQRNQLLLDRTDSRNELLHTMELDMPANAFITGGRKQAAWKIIVERKIAGTAVDVEYAFRVV